MTVLRGYSAAQVREAERPLLAAGEPLMLRAATALAAELRALALRRVVLLVGTGDNGGDALYAGAELASEGVPVVAVPVGDRMHGGGAAAARSAGVAFDADVEVTGSDVLVDGILGTGSRGALRGPARDVVSRLRSDWPGPTVVAVDLPSGIGTDDGAVDDGVVLPADVTVTFGAVKAGLLLGPGSRYAGRIVLVDLGLEPYLRGAPLVVR